MKIVRILLALALAALATTGFAAPKGKAFLHGVSSPEELASKIEMSLAKDASGASLIDPKRCKDDGSCASPKDYLLMFQESDPDAEIAELSQLSGYLKSLEVTEAPAGEYWISCLVPLGKGIYKPVLHCLSRPFKKDEKVWRNPKTRRIVLAGYCTNPVEKPVPPKHACAEIHFFTKPGDTVVRFGILGPAPVRDECTAVKRAGEEDFERWWAEECPDGHCGFFADAEFMRQKVQLVGSYQLEPGEHVLRVPASFAAKGSKYVVALCLDRAKTPWPGDAPSAAPESDEWLAYMGAVKEWNENHSDTMNVVWYGYENRVATLYYTKEDVPPGKPAIYWPWGEFGGGNK